MNAAVRLNGCAVQADAGKWRHDLTRIAKHGATNIAVIRAIKNESVSAPLRGALGVTCPGVNRLRRFNITLRYANRRAVTALAMLQWAKGGFAGKRRASPALRVTSVHVLRPRKSKIKQRWVWPRVLRTPAHVVLVRVPRPLRPGSRVARGSACTASASPSPRARARAAHAHTAACALRAHVYGQRLRKNA